VAISNPVALPEAPNFPPDHGAGWDESCGREHISLVWIASGLPTIRAQSRQPVLNKRDAGTWRELCLELDDNSPLSATLRGSEDVEQQVAWEKTEVSSWTRTYRRRLERHHYIQRGVRCARVQSLLPVKGATGFRRSKP
jgi:hypothetical protein